MEDDDEFGDLYTDVLPPLTTSFQSQPQQQPPPHPQQQPKQLPKAATTSFQGRPIDLNVNRDEDDDDDDDDDEDHFFGAPNFNSNPQNQTLAASQPGYKEPGNSGLIGIESDLRARALEAKGGNVKVSERVNGSSGLVDEADIEVMVEERDEKDNNFVVKGDNLADETKNNRDFSGKSGNSENFGTGEVGSRNGEINEDPMIPGLSIPGVSGVIENRANANNEDDWDSDSEDDLQIVLNDGNHGQMGMERMGGGEIGGEEDDEDDELVIVADNDDPSHQPMLMEEQEWGGEEVGHDGEKKELGEAAKVHGLGGGAVVAPKIGYSSHGYHQPFHSQFKYVRPGASPMPGAAPMGPGGSSGQVRPPVSMVPVAGRGRGDWRPTGIKGSPAMQKGFHSGYGMPIWGGSGSGRGLEFTLPSHKTVFEVDIDGFEEKPWRFPGVDVTDFFNFGLNEESWKDYCKQLEQLRLETTMQSKISVYVSGRTEQEYDPDLPPELAAAAGIQDIPSESTQVAKTDAGQNDLARGPTRERPPLPIGRAIQVETGYGERLPSIDTRKPRISDMDVIIEIVCQDSADADASPGDEIAEQADNDPGREDLGNGDEFEDLPQKDTKELDHLPHAYNSCKKKLVEGRMPLQNSVHSNMAEGAGSLPLSSEAPSEYHSDSREETPVYTSRSYAVSHEERQEKGRARDRYPIASNKESTIEQRFTDDKESSIDSLNGKHSPLSSSPLAVGIAAGQNIEPKDAMNNEIGTTDRGIDMNTEEEALNFTTKSDTLSDETVNPGLKKQKVSSRAKQPLPQEMDEGEDSRTARSSENSKARSGSGNYRKQQDGAEEEEVQGARSSHMGTQKRSIGGDEDSAQRKVRDERQENERHRSSVKGREDFYQHKGLDPYAAHHSRGKSESIDLRKDIDTAKEVRQRREDDLHGRRSRVENLRKRELFHETGSRHQSKVQEIERNEKDEYRHLRKQLDNENRRANYDKDIGSRHREREDYLKSRNENIDDLHNKRRKEEAHPRREQAERVEMLHAHREHSSRRKRERDEVTEQRRRDEPARMRDDDQHSIRYREEGVFLRETGERQREREEWHRLKQLNEEIVSKKDKEEVRVGIRSGRTAEDKTRSSQSRGKDDHRSFNKEYHSKDIERQNELLNRRNQPENECLSQHRGLAEFYAHGNQLSNDERRARHERVSTHDDHAANADKYKVHEKKHKEKSRKAKESEGVGHNSLAFSKKNQDEIGGQISDMVRPKGRVEQRNTENKIHTNNQPSKKHREEALSEDELSESRRGRSKLERWTSHKERDFSISTKASPSVKINQTVACSSSGASVGSKLHDEASKPVEDKQHGNEKDAASLDMNNADKKAMEDRHLDTVEKLKKRSERFKLPMPSEKEATAIKKMENEPVVSVHSENHVDFEIKAERPARKRRWTSN